MNTILLTLALLGHEGGLRLYVMLPPTIQVWSVPRTYENRPRMVSPGQREARLARASQRLGEAGRWDQLKMAVRELYSRETDPETIELLEKALKVAGDYSQFREAVGEYRLYKRDRVKWQVYQKRSVTQ